MDELNDKHQHHTETAPLTSNYQAHHVTFSKAFSGRQMSTRTNWHKQWHSRSSIQPPATDDELRAGSLECVGLKQRQGIKVAYLLLQISMQDW